MNDKFSQYISRLKPIRIIVYLLKKIKINKHGTSLYQVGHIFIQDFERNDIIERAGGVAFSFTLAIFPFIIFLITLIPYIQFFYPDMTVQNIMAFIGDLMPPSVYEPAAATIQDIVSQPRSGLLSFGAIFALYLSTNGMMTLIKSFNRCYRTKERRSYLKTLLIATILTVTLSFSLFLTVILLFVGQAVLEFLKNIGMFTQDYLLLAVILSRFLIMLSVFFLTISFIYYFAPAVHDRWSFVSPGSVTATLLAISVSYIFSFYIKNFGTYNKLYGSIGALLAFMFWLFLISMILLIGFELNASIDKAKQLSLAEKKAG
ncbi:MAG: YihY/virulence factor BrkB family protein [Candidatus Cyclobacteriaceae bacterium M3_2C_046]